MRNKYEDGEVYYTCDHCGRKLMDGELLRTRDFLTIRVGDEIQFEWWNKGDYCYGCNDALLRAIHDALPIPERCDRHFRDDRIAKAIEETLIVRGVGDDDV